MGSITNGKVRRAQVWDGEGVDPTDFNNLSAWSRAYLHDMVLGALMRTRLSSIGPMLTTAPQLYGFGHSGAPRNNGGANSYGCNPGPLLFAPAVSGDQVDGLTPRVIAYYLQQNEISGSFAAGNATFPRFDAVYVRLSDVDGPIGSRNFEDATNVKTTQALVVDKRTKLEWIAVQGTPAATPLVPAAPDATWAPWGTWYVPKAFNATFQSAFGNHGGQNVFDYRIPLGGVRRYVLDASHMYALAAGTTISPSTGEASSTSTGEVIGVTFPVRSGRIMSFGYGSTAATGTNQNQLYVRSANGSGAAAQPPNFNTIYGGVRPGDPTIVSANVRGYTLRDGLWQDPSGVQASVDAAGRQLLPLWANGYGSEAEDDTDPVGLPPNGGALTYLVCHWNANANTDGIIAFCVDVAG